MPSSSAEDPGRRTKTGSPGKCPDCLQVTCDTVAGSHVTWRQSGHFPGEPVFVRRPGSSAEDDGILLSVVLEARAGRSYLLALDPPTLEPRARAFLPHQ